MDESSETSKLEPASPLSVRVRIVLWLYGVLMPLICFAVSATSNNFLVDQPWQSGHISVYAALLLRRSAWLPFTPWLLLSMISLTCWAYQPLAARRLWVRFGLYSGVVLSVQYLVLVVLCTHIVTFFTTIFVLPTLFAISLIAESVATLYKRFQIWHLMWLTTLVAIGAAVYRVLPPHVHHLVLIPLFFILCSGPTLNLLAYLRAGWIVGRIERARFDQPYRLLGIGAAWTLGWIISWRFAVQAMLEEYSRLPTSNPNCYFANAAAHAHVWFGGSRRPSDARTRKRSIRVVTGPATLAMKRLKFLELALVATAPRMHRFIRRYYDRWGQPAARCCSQHYWFANFTCVALKPVEALAEIVRIAAGVPRERMAAIYGSNQERKR